MLASAIITSARTGGLSDPNSTRWSDARLLSLLNDGLRILQLDTIIFVEQLYVQLVLDLYEYDMSDVAMNILRVEYKNKALSHATHEQMDKISVKWKDDTGLTPLRFLTDKHRPGKFNLYPQLTTIEATLVDSVGQYGIITDITYTDFQLEMEEDFGQIGVPDGTGWLHVHFCKKMDTITSLSDEIDIDSVVATGLVHYIVARALRDNMDTQNRGLAKEEMDMWTELVDKFSIKKSKLYAQTALEVPYRGGIQ